jgi:hypothetical protein
MPASVFKKLEEIYPSIIEMMPNDQFNTHEFMRMLVKEHQELYVQALVEYSQYDHPSLMVVERIVKGLWECGDLIVYVGSEPIENVFEQKRDFEIWQKVRKQF